MTKVVQSDIETRERTWTLRVDGAVTAPDTITFTVRPGVGDDVTYTVGDGVIDNADGTGTWTIEAGDLPVGIYEWWCLATVDGQVVIPRQLAGKLEIRDR